MPLFAPDPFRDLRSLIDAVHGYVAYRVGAGPDAEDLTSEIFERAFRYRATYDPAKGPPLGWLIGIARRCIADHAAAIQRVHPLSELPPTADVEEGAIRRLSLMSAVNALDERDRELIALRYGADLSAGEIGRLAGMRSGAVRVALKRARERLARALAETPTDTVPAPPPVTLELANRYLKVEP